MTLQTEIEAAVAAERERCARIAEARTVLDGERYQREHDWRWPYAFNRVLRASMDIAAAIRSGAFANGEHEDRK